MWAYSACKRRKREVRVPNGKPGGKNLKGDNSSHHRSPFRLNPPLTQLKQTLQTWQLICAHYLQLQGLVRLAFPDRHKGVKTLDSRITAGSLHA